jgi:hypothetical protein
MVTGLSDNKRGKMQIEEIENTELLEELWFLVSRELRLSLPYPNLKVYLTKGLHELIGNGRARQGKSYSTEHKGIDKEMLFKGMDATVLKNKEALQTLKGGELEIFKRQQKDLVIFQPDYSILVEKNPQTQMEKDFLNNGLGGKDYEIHRIVHEMIHICEYETRRTFITRENHDKIEFEILMVFKKRQRAREEGKTFMEFLKSKEVSKTEELKIPKAPIIRMES